MNQNRSSDARYYWRATMHHIRVELERLADAIDADKRQESFQCIEALEGSLRTLRASIRNNMDQPHEAANSGAIRNAESRP